MLVIFGHIEVSALDTESAGDAFPMFGAQVTYDAKKEPPPVALWVGFRQHN